MIANENKTIETKTAELKRTHKKPYKVGKMYFGRKSTSRGAGWVVSASEDLSNPIAEFEVGKQARAHCEEIRDDQKQQPWNKSPAEVDINIPAGSGLTNIFDEVTNTEII
jgi:hypothetical protein